MFLDWSGSMSPQLLDTLKQTYNLVWFCKKAGIPFRVYGFQSGYSSSQYDDHPAIDPKHNTQGSNPFSPCALKFFVILL